jgi:N-acetyl sugar amidotransferase
MDTSDPRIDFSDVGECVYCQNFDLNIVPNWNMERGDPGALGSIADEIRRNNRGRDFDCIIGLSGGLDSSYTAYVAKEVMGLRPLLFHVDAGWNTDQAVSNIEKLVNGLGLDLYTEVVNWEEQKDLHRAFLKSQTDLQDYPQDTVFFSALYRFARRHRIKYVLTGANFSTECCREPLEWGGYPGIDLTLLRDVHRRFGSCDIDNLPLVDILTYRVWYQGILGMEVVKPLNLVRYFKAEAEDELEKRFDWKRFKHKHHESRFTRFYEDYWMPRKFGYEKRRAHFSSLVVTGQMTRAEAVRRISRPEMDDRFYLAEFEYVAHKLDLTVDELRSIFQGPNRTFRDYRNKYWLINLGARILRRVGAEHRYFR